MSPGVEGGTGQADAVIDCVAARAAGNAPVACHALSDSSPYLLADTAGASLGSDIARLAAIEGCARSGRWDEPACRAIVESPPPAIICLDW